MEKTGSIAAEKRRYIWQVQNFLPLAFSNFKITRTVCSTPFEIQLGENKTKWHFKMIRNEDNQFCEFSIYKEATDADNFTICGKVALQNADGKITIIRELEKESSAIDKGKGMGWRQFMKLADIVEDSKKFVTAGTLTFVIDVELYQNDSPKKEHSSNSISDMIGRLFTTKDFSDITIVCSNGISFKAHRCILASRSSVFKALLNPKVCGATNELKIGDIDSDNINELLRFIYTDKVENFGMYGGADLFKAAKKYGISELKAMCCSKLISDISINNVFATMTLADASKEERMLQKCMEFLEMNHRVLKDSEHWKNVTHELMIKYVKFLQERHTIILPSSSL